MIVIFPYPTQLKIRIILVTRRIVRIEFDRLEGDRESADDGLRRAHDALDATRTARAARESELASARIEHEWRARSVRTREHDLAGLGARLKSLEELEAGRAEFGDAARTVLAQADSKVSQKGAVADYLETPLMIDPSLDEFVPLFEARQEPVLV